MNKFVGYAMAMLVVGAAMGAVSQQGQVSRRIAIDPVLAVDRSQALQQTLPDMQPRAERVVAVAATGQRKPMPADPELPAPTTTGWMTAMDTQSYELVPELQSFVIKTLDLPQGEYLVTATLNMETITYGACLLGWEISEGVFVELDNATATAHIPGSVLQVKTLQRITLQAGHVIADPDGGTMGLVCLGGNAAIESAKVTRPRITAHRVGALGVAP